MFSRISSLSLGLAAVGFGIALLPHDAQAALNVLRNGVTWDATFEGDVAPPTASTPAWSNFDVNGFAGESSDGDIYTLVSGSVGTTGSYYITTGFTTGTARTMEMRVRIDPGPAEAGDGAIQFFTSVDGYFMSLSVGKNFVALNPSGSFIDQETVDNTSGFNTYRVTVDNSLAGNDKYKVYLNNNPTPILSSGSNNGNYVGADIDEVIFGDTSNGGTAGTSYTDFISWTDDGAFAPIPEPASLALVGLGGLLIRRRAK